VNSSLPTLTSIEADAKLADELPSFGARLGGLHPIEEGLGPGPVRDQLAQKHRFIRIDRVHHQVEELGDIGLKCSAFGAGLLRSGGGVAGGGAGTAG
jgi:hypothetical protein